MINKDTFDKGRAQWSNDVYRIEKKEGNALFVNGERYQYHQLQKIAAVHTKLLDDNDVVDKVAIKKEKKVVRDIRKEGIDASNVIDSKRTKKEIVKWDESLINRKVRKGKKEGKIKAYDIEGPYHWKVIFDNGDSEFMSKGELLKYFV